MGKASAPEEKAMGRGIWGPEGRPRPLPGNWPQGRSSEHMSACEGRALRCWPSGKASSGKQNYLKTSTLRMAQNSAPSAAPQAPRRWLRGPVALCGRPRTQDSVGGSSAHRPHGNDLRGWGRGGQGPGCPQLHGWRTHLARMLQAHPRWGLKRTQSTNPSHLQPQVCMCPPPLPSRRH